MPGPSRTTSRFTTSMTSTNQSLFVPIRSLESRPRRLSPRLSKHNARYVCARNNGRGRGRGRVCVAGYTRVKIWAYLDTGCCPMQVYSFSAIIPCVHFLSTFSCTYWYRSSVVLFSLYTLWYWNPGHLQPYHKVSVPLPSSHVGLDRAVRPAFFSCLVDSPRRIGLLQSPSLPIQQLYQACSIGPSRVRNEAVQEIYPTWYIRTYLVELQQQTKDSIYTRIAYQALVVQRKL